ncbi:MAG: hypothetical protein KGM24_10165 [Elusimicrobia bacterium]|nr:hypothetical protein [Elusimicrobiota bacterium]
MSEKREEKRTMGVTRRQSLVVLIAAAGAAAAKLPLVKRVRALGASRPGRKRRGPRARVSPAPHSVMRHG